MCPLSRALLIRLGMLALVFLAVPAAGWCQPVVISGTVLFDGNGGPLTTGLTYHVTSSVLVPQGETLTIEPDVAIKVASGRHIQIQGTLITNGTASDPVVFTSTKDATAGAFIDPGPPVPGDWRGIEFFQESDASTLTHTEIRFGRGRFGDPRGALRLTEADITMTNCTMSDSESTAMLVGLNSAPTVTGCAFDDNGGIAVDLVRIEHLQGFTNNTASGNLLGDYVQVTGGNLLTGNITGAVTLSPANSLGNGVIVIDGGLAADVGDSVTLQPGTILKWATPSTFSVGPGALICNGSAQNPVVLTTLLDDATLAGGDTNKDGNATVAAPGEWGGVRYRSNSAGSMQHTHVRFGGRGGDAVVELDADLTLRDCVFSDGPAAALDLVATNAVIERCSFERCQTAVDRARIDALSNLRGNTASNNVVNAIRVTSDNFSGPLTIGPENTLDTSGVLVVDTNVFVDASSSLTLERGMILKFDTLRSLTVNGAINVLGTGFQPVVLTALADDRHGGDTNGDGAATVAQPGDWSRVRLNSSATGTFEHAIVAFAGAGSNRALQLTAPALPLSSVRVEHANNDGFSIQSAAAPLHNLVAFGCGGDGIALLSGSSDVVHATVASCAGVGIDKSPGYTGVIRNSNVFGNGGGNYVGISAGDLRHSNGDPALAGTLGNISLDPLFVDQANGDLRLQAGSPCLEAAHLSTAVPLLVDHREASRVLDAELDGIALPDMGAFERGAHNLTVTGQPVGGDTLTFSVTGPPSTVIWAFGFQDGSLFLPPLGILTAGSFPTTVIFATLPSNVPLPIQLPAQTGLTNVPVAVQALALPTGLPGRGTFTERYRARLIDQP